jgi:N-acetylglucosaminyldiphosphoundecaprenol N-acetyl-beta-D-mannosaminyltransferase
MLPDFSRNVRLVLGLPFDVVTEAQAAQALERAIADQRQCFLSTPNLNFAVGCLVDAEFRASVLQSDLSIADGWPIVAVARLIGAALPERVAGSTLFDRLIRTARQAPVRVYFFGGPAGAAEAACERLNSGDTLGAACVGFSSPGFGSVLDMSAPSQINTINASHADFLVVALGAKKGQAWIQSNLRRLDAFVISHLGAVVNFVAGSVSRAPRWIQAARLEWLWRIKEEPSLWQRYAADGSALLRLIVTRAVPLAVHQRATAPAPSDFTRATLSVSRVQDETIIKLEGAWSQANAAPLRSHFTAHAAAGGAVSIDASGVSYLDASVMALLSLLYGWQLKTGNGYRLIQPSNAVQKTLRLACAEYLLTPHKTVRIDGIDDPAETAGLPHHGRAADNSSSEKHMRIS